MKLIVHMSAEDLLKSKNNLVKVSVQVQGKTGTYQSHRWKSSGVALNTLYQDMKSQGVNSPEDSVFKNKATGKELNGEELIKEYKKLGTTITLQEFVKKNYKISNKKSSDNEEDMVYTVGEKINIGDKDNDIRRIQEEYRKIITKTKQQRRSDGLYEGVRGRLRELTERWMDSRNGGNRVSNGYVTLETKHNIFGVYKEVNGDVFQEIFALHKDNIKNGELVDLHEGKGAYDNCKCFLSSDGLQGLAIEPNGNIISVYNADVYNPVTNPNGKRNWVKVAFELAIENGGDRLDCYDSKSQPLTQIYKKYGFKEVSRMDYNMEYDHDNIAKNHGNPDVVFMAYSDKELPIKTFGKDEYDEALNYRDEIANKIKI